MRSTPLVSGSFSAALSIDHRRCLAGAAWIIRHRWLLILSLPRTFASAAEDIILDLLLARRSTYLGWLVLRYQSRGQEQYQQAIDRARRKLDIAVSNMSQGLLLFDASKRVVVANRRYIEMYGLSSDVVKPGCAFRDLLHHRQDSGSFFGDVDKYCTDLDAELAQGKMTSLTTRIPGGRLIRVVNQPLSEGGWVATHDDITEQQNIEETLRQQKLQLDTALKICRRA